MFVVLALSRLTIGGLGPVTSLYVGQFGLAAALVPTVAGLAFSVVGVGQGITAPWLGRLGDRRGYKPVLLATLAGTALFILPQAWVTSAWQFLALRGSSRGSLSGASSRPPTPSSDAWPHPVSRARPTGWPSAPRPWGSSSDRS
jgi:MFS family permease